MINRIIEIKVGEKLGRLEEIVPKDIIRNITLIVFDTIDNRMAYMMNGGFLLVAGNAVCGDIVVEKVRFPFPFKFKVLGKFAPDEGLTWNHLFPGLHFTEDWSYQACECLGVEY